MSLEGSGDEPSHDGFSDSEGEEGGEELFEDEMDDENFFNTGAAALTNYGAILFGDPQLDPSEPDCPPELVALSTHLVNFALFCGYTNLHASEAPHDSSLDYSLRLDDLRGEHLHGPEGRDDEWMSSAFFLSCSKERLDAIRSATAASYEASSGLLPIGPLDSEVLVMQTDKGSAVERRMVRTVHALTLSAPEKATYFSF